MRFPKTLALAAALLATGCASTPKPPIPPAFNLYSYKRLVILPFENPTPDKALTRDLGTALAMDMSRLRAAAITDPTQSGAYLRGLGLDGADLATDDNLRRKLAAKFASDILMVGVIDGYEEVLEDKTPQRITKNGGAEWGFYTVRRVTIHSTYKLLDPATGSLLWSQGATGSSSKNTWNPLPIPGEVKVPPLGGFETILKTVKRKLPRKPQAASSPKYLEDNRLAAMRSEAIGTNLQYLLVDFYGKRGWVPGPR